MSKKRLFEAVATLVGCTIGAGILGIPYVVARAGVLTGIFNILVVGGIFLLINLYLGEITLRTRGRHQLTGYAEKYTGKLGKYVMFISSIIGSYGAIIAYIMGGGVALAVLLKADVLISSIVFFGIMGLLIYLGLEAIEKSESIMAPILIGLIVIVFLFAVFKINTDNLTGFDLSKLFMPFGVVAFAMMGTSAIPEVREEMEKNKKQLKKAIMIGTAIPIAVYILFAIAIVGVHGLSTPEIGAMKLSVVVGDEFSFLGEIMAILNMSTSFLAIGLAIKELFFYDYGLHKNTSWLLACFVPFMIFLLMYFFKLASFTSILNFTGIIAGVITGSMVIIMVLKAKEKCERKPEYSIYINKFIAYTLILILIIGGVFKLIIH